MKGFFSNVISCFTLFWRTLVGTIVMVKQCVQIAKSHVNKQNLKEDSSNEKEEQTDSRNCE